MHARRHASIDNEEGVPRWTLMSSAIQSAQKLGGQLAAVLKGYAAPELLSSRQVESRPVGRYTAQHCMAAPALTIFARQAHAEKATEFFPIVGYRYRSQAVLSEDDERRPAEDGIELVDREELTRVPGTRIPHVWPERRSSRISTPDLLNGPLCC